MHIAVTLTVKNKATEAAIEGVLLYVLSEDGSTLYAETSTDGDGAAFLLLPEDTRFQVRVRYATLRTPYRFLLTTQPYADGVSQALEAYLSCWGPEDSRDPTLCRVWERFLDRPFAGAYVFCKMVDPFLVTSQGVHLSTSIPGEVLNGVFSAELPRGARFLFGLPGEEARVEAKIPDQGSCRLTDLIFPHVEALTAQGPLSLSVGETLHETLFLLSDGRTVPLTRANGVWSAEEGLVATPAETGLVLTASAPGTYEVTFTESPADSPFPESLWGARPSTPPVAGLPLQVVVT